MHEEGGRNGRRERIREYVREMEIDDEGIRIEKGDRYATKARRAKEREKEREIGENKRGGSTLRQRGTKGVKGVNDARARVRGVNAVCLRSTL